MQQVWVVERHEQHRQGSASTVAYLASTRDRAEAFIRDQDRRSSGYPWWWAIYPQALDKANNDGFESERFYYDSSGNSVDCVSWDETYQVAQAID